MKNLIIISLLIISINKSFSQTYVIRRIDDYNPTSTVETARYIGSIQEKMQGRYDANYQKLTNEINHIKQKINDLPFDYNTRKNILSRFVYECLKNVDNSGINMTSNSDVTKAINYIYDSVNSYINDVRIGKIGIQIDKENGNFLIYKIIYGGSAWRDSQLKEGDIILKIGEYRGDLIDVRGISSFEEVADLIRGEKDTKVTLIVKKTDGTIREVTITRE